MLFIIGPARTGPLMRKIASLLEDAGRPVSVIATEGQQLLDFPQLAQATVLVCMMTPCGAREMDAMPALRGIVSPLLGYEWIDVEEATRRSIPVVNGEIRESRESMAEATIMLVLALLYRLRETEAELRVGGERVQYRNMLKGRTVGIVGYGGIAREIVHRLKGWHATILVHTRQAQKNEEGISFVSSEHLLAASDVVLLMTRLDDGSRHWLDRSRMQLMKRGVLLVNTARGGLVDEDALVEALQSGQVGAAALDVFEIEPLLTSHPFRQLPNVILTPHSVGHTAQMIEQIPPTAVANILALLDGKLPESCRNKSLLTPVKDQLPCF
jgi:D-3-phosphoglycerate dehydrogenase / 2-oxoglutarate reductase